MIDALPSPLKEEGTAARLKGMPPTVRVVVKLTAKLEVHEVEGDAEEPQSIEYTPTSPPFSPTNR
jgi:hypothetical protein